MSKIIIALDNSHGLNTLGKRTPIFTDGIKSSYTGLNFMHEWEFSRRVVQLLKIELERCGLIVIEVSPTENDTSIEKRCQIANNAGANLYVSVHANADKGIWGNANGIETLTYGSGESLRIGQIIQRHLITDTGLRDRGMKDGSWLGVVQGTNMPAVLTENGFMDNLIEAKLLLSEQYRQKVAVAHAKGICEAFGVKYIPGVQSIVVSNGTYRSVKATVEGKEVPAIIVGDYVYVHWCSLDIVGNKDYNYKFSDNDTKVKFVINGKEVESVLYEGNSYILFSKIHKYIEWELKNGVYIFYIPKQQPAPAPTTQQVQQPVVNTQVEPKQATKDSIDILVEKGIINTPEYWRGLLEGTQQFNKDYLKILLDRVAAKLT